MDSPFTNLDFERFSYRQGQLLASRDFRDQQRMEEARRWMHNTAMHNAWGVAVGYEFSLSGNNPESWDVDETLTIQPGIAYDCFGRELILSRPVKFKRNIFADEQGNLRAEFSRQTLFLVMKFQETAKAPAGEGCAGAQSRALAAPLFCWKPKNEVCYGLEIPILIVSFPSVLESLPSEQTNRLSVQRYAVSQARSQARPKMASGQTVPGQTVWRKWEIQPAASFSHVPSPITLGLQVSIDTTDAGFQQTPCYFAWLRGPLAPIVADTLFLPAYFISLADTRPAGFTARVFFLGATSRAEGVMRGTFAALAKINRPVTHVDPVGANAHQLTICWLAVESKDLAHDPIGRPAGGFNPI